MVERSGDEPFGLRRRVLRRHDRGCAHDGDGHPTEEVELTVAQRVVHQRPALLRRQVGRADQVKNSETLGVRTRNGTYRGEFPNPVGRAYRADTAHPRISISGVRRVELVTHPIQLTDGCSTIASLTGNA